MALALLELATMVAASPEVVDAVDDETGRAFTPAEAVARATGLCERALADTAETSTLWAERAFALGLARSQGFELGAQPDAIDGAVELMRNAIERGSARADQELALAKVLTERGGRRDTVEATELLTRLSESAADHAFEAFEAARYHGYWASERGEWAEAAAAYTRALVAREHFRQLQGGWAIARAWLSETHAIPSQGAYAFARAGDVRAAAAFLERGLATGAAERLHLDAGDRAALEPEEGSLGNPVVYLLCTEPGGVALVHDGEWRAVVLPELTPGSLYDVAGVFYAGSHHGQPTEAVIRATAELCARLWMTVMEPVLAAIDAASPTLTLIPDGILAQLPLHAAHTAGEAGALDRITVRYAPSGWMLRRARSRATTVARRILAVADPGIPPLPPLEWAPAEAELAATSFPERVVLPDREAHVETVASSLADNHVVHLACHGIARFDDPRESAVLLADGPLTLARMLEVELVQTRLVVLSACDSALMDIAVPEEKFSLPSGLLEAGAAAVLGTLWLVDDRSTMLLMSRFYELWAGGLEPPRALREAQLWLRDATARELRAWLSERAQSAWAAAAPRSIIDQLEHALDGLSADEQPFAAPYYWAGFAYVGA